MIGYVTLGTNDLQRATKYYDELLAVIGLVRVKTSETYAAWAKSPGDSMLMIIKPNDGKPATIGNGVMPAIGVKTEDEVGALHKKAMSLGMTNEGDPGYRGENFYGCYFRDPDGNKLCAFCEDWLASG